MAAAPTTSLEDTAAAVAEQHWFRVAGPWAAVATMIIKTPALVAVGIMQMNMADDGTNPGVIMANTTAQTSRRCVAGMTVTMNPNPHIEKPTWYIAVVIIPVWTTKQG